LLHQDSLLYAATVATAVRASGDLEIATARFFRVLSDPTRLRILELLVEAPRTVSELVEILECPQSRVSNHLACLRWCEFVDDERRGRQVTYRIRDQRVRRLVNAARSMAAEHCEHLVSCQRIGPDWI
jgi:ArsR family transcriptional regulator